MVSGGWFQVVSGGFRWFQVVSSGFRWFQVIPTFSNYNIQLQSMVMNLSRLIRQWKS